MNQMEETATVAWLDATARLRELIARGRDDSALTTTEWALLVAGVAAIAIAVVAIIRATTEDIANNIPTG
jgi:hypothetical protein